MSVETLSTETLSVQNFVDQMVQASPQICALVNFAWLLNIGHHPTKDGEGRDGVSKQHFRGQEQVMLSLIANDRQ